MKKLYYILSISLSLALIIPSFFISNPYLVILSNIGCSGMAAALMALFLERIIQKQQETSKDKARKAYFNQLHRELKNMLERIVWFDDRMNDSTFDWDKKPAEYSSLRYQLAAHTQYSDYSLTDQQFAERLKAIQIKYDLDNQKETPPAEKEKMNKMFVILAESGGDILRQIRMIEDNKLILDLQDYMSLDDIEALRFHITLSISLMGSREKNYGVAVLMLQLAYKKISGICGTDKSFKIDLNGSVHVNEL